MEFSLPKGKSLSVFSLTMINVIAIDSLRNLPINASYGFSIAFLYVLGTLCFLLPCALVTAELATHHPKTGGAYVWVREAFGERWGFFSIWLQWVYNVVWYPTILSFIAASIAYLINPELANNKFFMLPMIMSLFLLATLLNCLGMKTSSWMSIIGALLGTIIPMLLITLLGLAWIMQGHALAIPFSINAFIPSFGDIKNIAFTVVLLFSLMGLEMSAVHAGEVKNPARDFPRALCYSSIIIVSSLILASIAIALVVAPADLNLVSGLNQAFQLFLSAYHLEFLLPLAVLLIIVGGFAGMSAWVLGPPKGLMIAAQEGCAPKFFGKTNRKGAPASVLILQAVVVCLLCSLFLCFDKISTTYWLLSDLTAQLALIYYISFFAAAIRLRYTTSAKENAYRIPGGKFGMCFVAGIGILTCLAAIIFGFIPPGKMSLEASMTHFQLILGAGILVFALPPFVIYWWQKRH